MKVLNARYISSAVGISGCPKNKLPDFAFTGRSNVGKSSLINMLAGKKDIARTSATPGKTRMINYFLIDDKWHMVDLPGYGYAKVSRTERSAFSKLITEYIHQRESLHCLFVLVDCRLEPQESDLHFIRFLGENGVPFAIIFTKTDKLSPSQLKVNTDLFKKTLLAEWETLPEIFYTSSHNKQGREEVLQYIEKIISEIR